ncbi:DegT/DnrJ/EryC1/StrS family aminotransferase [Paenibacillus aurantiacus]|uniref:DegT/DnrJ/EryC1/StrS family aminotransferase n=1 Tax=Paenibacillus aurantiacus TaxID=1936118 RepID=A0ABV5KKY3_9BACL
MIKLTDIATVNQQVSGDVIEKMTAIIRDNTFVNGSDVLAFEEKFARYLGVKYCFGVGNGTDALEIALAALDLPKDAEVIIPDCTFIATANAVINVGLRPVIADVGSNLTMNADELERLITPDTKAIIPVHLYGHPAPMTKIMELADAYNLAVVEDSAQAHGATYKGRMAGSIGDLGCFSFYPSKNLGAFGDAGAITTNDEALADKIRLIRDHGRISKYEYRRTGRNSKLDSIQAAVLVTKLDYLESWIKARNEVAAVYARVFADVKPIVLPMVEPENRHVYHQYAIRCERRDELMEHLLKSGVECGIHYPTAISQEPFIAGHEMLYANYRSRRYVNELLSLPMGTHLSEADISYIASCVEHFYQENTNLPPYTVSTSAV